MKVIRANTLHEGNTTVSGMSVGEIKDALLDLRLKRHTEGTDCPQWILDAIAQYKSELVKRGVTERFELTSRFVSEGVVSPRTAYAREVVAALGYEYGMKWKDATSSGYRVKLYRSHDPVEKLDLRAEVAKLRKELDDLGFTDVRSYSGGADGRWVCIVVPYEKKAQAVKEAELRRSDKPLKAHAELVDKYAEVRDMQEKLQEQAQAIQAMVNEKGNLANTLAAEIEKFAAEYENQTIRTKRVLAKLEEIPAAKSKAVSWKKYIDWSLGKFMTISSELHKEASDFLEATKQLIPAKKVLQHQRVENVVEGAATVLSGLAARLARTGKKIDDLEAVVKKIG